MVFFDLGCWGLGRFAQSLGFVAVWQLGGDSRTGLDGLCLGLFLQFKAGSWIDGPSFALLVDTLARGLGVWPLPKLALLLLTLVTLCRWCGLKTVRWFDAYL